MIVGLMGLVSATVFLSICVCFRISGVRLCVSVCMSVHLSACLSFSFWLSVCHLVCICLTVCLSICSCIGSVCLYSCLSLCLSVFLSVCSVSTLSDLGLTTLFGSFIAGIPHFVVGLDLRIDRLRDDLFLHYHQLKEEMKEDEK